MQYKYFTVHDAKADGYLPPFMQPNEAMAIRMFNTMVNDPSHQFGQHPQDYTLFYLGTWEDENAKLSPAPAPVSLGNGLEHQQLQAVPAAVDSVINEERRNA